MTGQIQLGLPSVTSAQQHVKMGKLNAFAITTKSCSALVPEALIRTEMAKWAKVIKAAGIRVD